MDSNRMFPYAPTSEGRKGNSLLNATHLRVAARDWFRDQASSVRYKVILGRVSPMV